MSMNRNHDIQLFICDKRLFTTYHMLNVRGHTAVVLVSFVHHLITGGACLHSESLEMQYVTQRHKFEYYLRLEMMKWFNSFATGNTRVCD